jgi:uncharacterized protein
MPYAKLVHRSVTPSINPNRLPSQDSGYVGGEVRIANLYIYPVKSCAGISCDKIRLTETGPAHDRDWMVVDIDGSFVTQRQLPTLALIVPAIHDDYLELRAPGMPRLHLPVQASGTSRRVKVWDDVLCAYDKGDEAANWFSSFAGSSLRLVQFDPREHRLSSAKWVRNHIARNKFTDGYPLLVLSEASVSDLNARLTAPVPVNRFRPNVLISGVGPYEEDFISELEFESVSLAIVKACTRCQVINTDQATATVAIDPLLTLSSYRAHAALGGAATLGQNAVISRGIGAELKVGAKASISWNF